MSLCCNQGPSFRVGDLHGLQLSLCCLTLLHRVPDANRESFVLQMDSVGFALDATPSETCLKQLLLRGWSPSQHLLQLQPPPACPSSSCCFYYLPFLLPLCLFLSFHWGVDCSNCISNFVSSLTLGRTGGIILGLIIPSPASLSLWFLTEWLLRNSPICIFLVTT